MMLDSVISPGMILTDILTLSNEPTDPVISVLCCTTLSTEGSMYFASKYEARDATTVTPIT